MGLDGAKGLREKRERQMERLREEFRTCEYPNSGAYSPVPTKVGNLMEQVGRPEFRKLQ